MKIADREDTLTLDRDGKSIFVGDVVRLEQDINQDVHGDWCDYEVCKRPGGYTLMYLRSQKGQKLPKHYTGNHIPYITERDAKVMIFSTDPVSIPEFVKISE